MSAFSTWIPPTRGRPPSLWNFDNPGIADFTTILDGSIIGRIDFKIATGTVDIPLEQVNLNFLKATGAASGIVVGPPPQINTIEIIVPGRACPWDCQETPDDKVGTADLLALLSQWGMPGLCDFDGSGDVSTADLLKLLSSWGDCPEGEAP